MQVTGVMSESTRVFFVCVCFCFVFEKALPLRPHSGIRDSYPGHGAHMPGGLVSHPQKVRGRIRGGSLLRWEQRHRHQQGETSGSQETGRHWKADTGTAGETGQGLECRMNGLGGGLPGVRTRRVMATTQDTEQSFNYAPQSPPWKQENASYICFTSFPNRLLPCGKISRRIRNRPSSYSERGLSGDGAVRAGVGSARRNPGSQNVLHNDFGWLHNSP